jgi:uncharacterized protein (DUF488 family)
MTVYTIGHSNHEPETFVALILRHAIDAVCDVRSNPHSRYNPQFNREVLERTLAAKGIRYLFLGRELGARSEDPGCYENGVVRYDRLAATPLFQEGLARVREGAAKGLRVALMCAEKDPLECHRTILVARRLDESGLDVQHIHADGGLELHADAMVRLRQLHRLPEADLFRTPADILAEAYARQESRIAYEIEETALRQAAG